MAGSGINDSDKLTSGAQWVPPRADAWNTLLESVEPSLREGVDRGSRGRKGAQTTWRGKNIGASAAVYTPVSFLPAQASTTAPEANSNIVFDFTPGFSSGTQWSDRIVGILQEPAESNGRLIVPVVVEGLTWAWVDVKNTSHKTVLANNTTGRFETSEVGGHRILSTLPATGDYYVLIDLVREWGWDEKWVIGTAAAELAWNVEGTINVSVGPNTSGTIQASLFYFVDPTETISAGKEVACRYFPDVNKWYVMHAECE